MLCLPEINKPYMTYTQPRAAHLTPSQEADKSLCAKLREKKGKFEFEQSLDINSICSER